MERIFAMTSAFVACLATLLLFFSKDVEPFAHLFGHDTQVPMSQEALSDGTKSSWDIRYHLGGNGPWIPKINGIVNETIYPPPGCKVDQVHMISRHAERYPTVAVGLRMLDLHKRIREANITLQGDLAFANNWTFFTNDPAEHLENLVSTGPYAGTLEAFTTGVKLRTRYKHLLDQAIQTGPVSFWASDSARVIDTAKYFAAGFFGIDWLSLADLYIVPETPERGADTLTPGRTCLKYRADVDDFGHAYGYRMMDAIRSVYEPAIVERLANENPHMPFTADDVFTMQLLCGFDTLARGSSQWCDVFSQEEMESFEYARDVIHYYRAGPGNPYSPSLGWLWLNATANLLREGQPAGPLFFSFVHDGDIVPLLSALDLFPQTPELPVTHIPNNRNWSTSDVVPMGGRLIFERLSCAVEPNCWSNAPFYPNHVYCGEQQDEIFVRLNVNDGIIKIPDCDSGPGHSCPLDWFLYHVGKRGSEIDEFRYICGLEQDAPDRITFLHQ